MMKSSFHKCKTLYIVAIIHCCEKQGRRRKMQQLNHNSGATTTTRSIFQEWTKVSSQLVTAATNLCEQCCNSRYYYTAAAAMDCWKMNKGNAPRNNTSSRRPDGGTRSMSSKSTLDCCGGSSRPSSSSRPSRTVTVYRALRPRESLYDGLCPCNLNSKQSLHHFILQGITTSTKAASPRGRSRLQRRRNTTTGGRFLSVTLQPETAIYFALKRAWLDEEEHDDAGQQLPPARIAKITLDLDGDEYRQLYDDDDGDEDVWSDSARTSLSSSEEDVSAENNGQHTSTTTTATTLYHVASVARCEKWTGLALEHAQTFRDEICLTRPIAACNIEKVIFLTQQDVAYFINNSKLLHHHQSSFSHSRSLLDTYNAFHAFRQVYRTWPGRIAFMNRSNTKLQDGQRLRIVEVTTQLLVQRPRHCRHVQQIINDGGLFAIGLSHVCDSDDEDDANENDNENDDNHHGGQHGGGVVVVYGQSRNNSTSTGSRAYAGKDARPIGCICPQHARILAPHHLAHGVRYRRYELPFQQQQQPSSSSPPLLPLTTTSAKLTLLLQMSLYEAKHVVERIEKTRIGSASIHFPDGPSFLSPGSL
jgi:hypothetical protein